MSFCRNVALATARRYMEAGADVVAVVDPMTSQIFPAAFEKFVSPYVVPIFESVHAAWKASSFFVCGNATRNVEKMCECRPLNISIDENIPLSYVQDICRKHGISFGGTIPLTVVMLFGTPNDNSRAALACVNTGGTQGYILSPGSDRPFDVPAENVEAVAQVAHGEICSFDQLPPEKEAGVEVERYDYSNLDRVLVEVFTLDSGSCAPCQ